MQLRRSPLDAAHRALGAKLAAFGGWEMPLAYEAGTIAEHRACRTAAAVFDVSHLGTVRVAGTGALERLQLALTNDLAKIAPGRAQYTHLLSDDGSVADDIIVWWVSMERFDVMPNASNTSRVVEAVGGADVTAERAVLAVQGPRARACVGAVASDAAAVGRFEVAEVGSWVVAGTGYTGEDGLELAVPADEASAVWEALLTEGVQPAGLGARDTLRLEAGLPLHGHELGPGITPLQAGLGWVVAWDKGEFRGRAALEAERAAGPARRLRGIETDGRRPPREGSAVLLDGRRVGTVSSGNFSPTLERGIAMAFLPPEVGPGTRVTLDLRGTEVEGRVVTLPFVRRQTSA